MTEPLTPKRRSISKRLRFEVLKRDNFTCQYCGRKAPDVVLHIDHVRAVALGGRNDFWNLSTACADCNLGKGATHNWADRPEWALNSFEVEARRMATLCRQYLGPYTDRTKALLDVLMDDVPPEYIEIAITTSAAWELVAVLCVRYAKDKTREIIEGLDPEVRSTLTPDTIARCYSDVEMDERQKTLLPIGHP